MDGHRREAVLQRGGHRGLAVFHDGDLLAVGREQRDRGFTVDLNILHIGHILDAQHQQILGAQGTNAINLGHCSTPSPSDPTPAVWRVASSRSHLLSASTVTRLAVLFSPPALLIGTVRTWLTALGRCRSTDRRPLSSVAAFTTMPSASTKLRWNCLAAIPR